MKNNSLEKAGENFAKAAQKAALSIQEFAKALESIPKNLNQTTQKPS